MTPVRLPTLIPIWAIACPRLARLLPVATSQLQTVAGGAGLSCSRDNTANRVAAPHAFHQNLCRKCGPEAPPSRIPAVVVGGYSAAIDKRLYSSTDYLLHIHSELRSNSCERFLPRQYRRTR